jgi:hypothetical protein
MCSPEPEVTNDGPKCGRAGPRVIEGKAQGHKWAYPLAALVQPGPIESLAPSSGSPLTTDSTIFLQTGWAMEDIVPSQPMVWKGITQ